MAAGWVLTAFGLLAVIVEPPIFMLADRYPRRWFVCGGLGALGAVCVAAGLAPSYGWLLVALLLFGPASGVGVGLAQATLMDVHPDRRERGSSAPANPGSGPQRGTALRPQRWSARGRTAPPWSRPR